MVDVFVERRLLYYQLMRFIAHIGNSYLVRVVTIVAIPKIRYLVVLRVMTKRNLPSFFLFSRV